MSKALEIIIVLKGVYTSISDATGRVWFNLNGHPLLATAGSGDVLSGIITSYLAQGKSPILAARMGVYQHANAAQYLTTKGIKNGSAGMLSDALPYLESVR
jgi:NAD(P)H-hydrate epimerase